MSKHVDLRLKRHKRIRAKISGTAVRPRLAVFRSNLALYVQIIDDDAQKTIASAKAKGRNKAQAHILGVDIAKKVKAMGIKAVVFDRGGYRYHGTIAEIAEGAREGGLTL